MQHQEVIKTLEKLIPQGAKEGPENVLLKYANDQNLAPAQLERLAQMYNTAMTINFMDKSANRGDTFQVIDVDSLLGQFTNPVVDIAKSATDDVIPAEWAGWFDNSEPLQKAASIREEMSVPDWIGLARGDVDNGIESRSSGWDNHDNGDYEGYVTATPDGFWDTLSKEANDKFEEESVSLIIADAEEDFRKIASTIDDLIRTGASFQEMVTDACSAYTECVKSAKAIGGYLKKEVDTNARVSVYIDAFDTVELFKEAADILDNLKAARAYKAASSEVLEPVEEEKDTDSDNTSGSNPEGQRGQGPPETERTNKSPSQGDTNAPKKRKRKNGDAEEVQQLEPSVIPPEPASLGSAHDVAPDARSKNTLSNVENLARAGVDLGNAQVDNAIAAFNPDTYFGSVGDTVNKMKGVGPGYAKTRQTVDGAIGDAKAETTVQSLMMTDPIISKADPEMVIELVNTLASASPQVAQDPNLLRLALREAIQYEAIPIHTFKDIVEMEKNRQSGIKDQQQNISSQYKI